MKQSLERINKAIKRYGKNIGPENLPGPFEIVTKPTSPSLARENLESEGSSLFGSVLASDCSNMHKKAFSENVAESIVCDSDTQDIENFTLGPAQFKGLRNDSALKKYQTNQKEAGGAEVGRNRKYFPKYSSADRVNNHKRKFVVKQEPQKVSMHRNKGMVLSPLVLIDDHNAYFKRDRGSAPNVDHNVAQKLDFQNGIIIDKNYNGATSSVRSSRLSDHVNGQRNSNHAVPLGSQKYMGKFRMNQSRMSKVSNSMKRTLKMRKNKKFPSDFF